MDINSDQSLRASRLNLVTTSPPPAAPASGQGSSGSSSSQVSSAAKDLANLAKLAHQAPDVDQNKVDALKSQIDSGTYKVDVDKLADHLSKFL